MKLSRLIEELQELQKKFPDDTTEIYALNDSKWINEKAVIDVRFSEREGKNARILIIYSKYH